MLKNDGEGYTQCTWNPVQCSWGQVRVHDTILVIHWLLEHAELDAKDDAILWETMDMLYDMSRFKWEDWYKNGRYEKVIGNPTTDNPLFPYIHGVNVGQGLKSAAVIRRFTHRDSLSKTTTNGVDWTFKYKGAASGTILADEIQRDLAPFMGSELCTAVETGYSLAYLYQALGTNSFADRAELVIFNALPTMLTHDMWAHQYMTRPNAPWALNQHRQPSLFTTANGVATIFGLEPQYPCCTVNFPQGYPKFLANSWARADKGLVHALLSPSTVDTTIPEIGRVAITCETEYPFSNRLRYIVDAESDFDLYLRFPSWGVLTKSVLSLSADGAEAETLPMSPNENTGLLRVSVPKGKSILEYYIDYAVRVETRERADNAVSVYVGNVLYALDVGESVTSSLPHRYWETSGNGTTEFSEYENVKDNYFNFTKPWNVAIDPSTIRHHEHTDAGIQRGFSARQADKGPTNYLTVQGCQIDWPVREGVAPDVPPTDPACVTEKQTYRMIPYGLAKIHMSELPTIKLSRRRGSAVPGRIVATKGVVDSDGPSDL
ncbi:uncharacterized protein B0H64DRAFT_317278 [Chaetomium fimeti]|uniref:Uncharacterized protein n=1 Tax=Chaetomium fimeti TaxID=1854472 RepID=A0AAE0HN52_9PEZI|nr:hypothetical protein B0H64DRAFT_317278 [Chaetomium fimeti]